MALQFPEKTAVGPKRGRLPFYRSAGEAGIHSGRRPDRAPLAVATLMAGAGDEMTERSLPEETVRAGLSESEMRANVIRLAFGRDPRRYEQFCEAIRSAIPPGTAAVLRGSAVTGFRHGD